MHAGTPTRRRPARSLTAVAALLVAVDLTACGGGRPGPRVLLVTLDTTRADHLSPWGYTRDTSPHLAALARSGVTFLRAYCNMPSTDPSHTTMLTGLYPRRHGITRNGQKAVAGLRSLPSLLKSAGCATAAFVSRNHLDPAELGLPGFDSTERPAGGERRAEETASSAIRWLERQGEDGFFLWVHLFDPHRPYDPPPEFAQRFGEGPPQLRLGDGPWLTPTLRYTPAQTANNIRLYDAEISYADEWLGRIVAAADRLPGPPPLIVVAADHGESCDELQERFGYAFDHGEFLYDHQTHVPLVLRWKGHLPEGRTVNALVELADLAPTVLELAGMPGLLSADGASRAALARGTTEEGARAVFVQRRSFDKPPRPWLASEEVAVVSGWDKLIASAARGEELYDLKADPTETRNRIQNDPQRATTLRALLGEWLRNHPPVVAGGEPDADKIRDLKSLGYVN